MQSKVKNHKLDAGSLCIGVDGCRGGWIAAVYDHGKLCVEKYNSISAVIQAYPSFDEFLMDMVVGLASDSKQIRPDAAARKLIPGRASMIFAIPCRQAVYADTEAEQVEANKRVLGKSLAKQTMGIISKMREVDSFLQENPKYKELFKESHPEVCFSRLSGAVVMSKKAQPEGLRERVAILKRYLPDLEQDFVLTQAKLYKCNPDDVVDAICLAVSANLVFQGQSEILPEQPMKNNEGILMRLTIPSEQK